MGNSEKHREIIKKFLNASEIDISCPTDESLNLYEHAFTHSSFSSDGRSYERLEFLGDRVLNLIVANYLFERTEVYDPGKMAEKMEFVKNKNLGAITKKMKLFPQDLINLGKNTELTPKIIAGVFEAFIGAIYKIHGLDKAQQVTLKLFSKEIENFKTENFIGILKEYCEEKHISQPKYSHLSQIEVDSTSGFVCCVRIDEKLVGHGVGRDKTDAEQEAAYFALNNLNAMPNGF